MAQAEVAKTTRKDPVLSKVLQYVKQGWPAKAKQGELQPCANKKPSLTEWMFSLGQQGSDTGKVSPESSANIT